MCENRRWIQRTISHINSGAVPYNFSFTPPIRQSLELHYGDIDLEEILGFPLRMSSPESIKPLYASPQKFGELARDEFGVLWSTNELDRGSPIGPCLPEPDVRHYTFPNPAASYRFDALGDWCNKHREQYRIIWVGDLWERATFMRGMEGILTDLALAPRFVQELLHGISNYILQTMQILFDRFDFDGVALSDDYGTQKSMLMAPRQWRRFIRPRLSKIYELARKHGRTVFHHSCGNIHPIIGDMIDMGLDILHPIQPEAMDILRLKREFGRHLTFCGGLRTQDLLPRGSIQEVRNEVRRLKREMGRGSGYILEPGISIQADVPLDNVVAMIEEAAKAD